MKYLFDNNISFRLVRMLAALDVEAEALRDRFPQDIDDSAFFNKIAGEQLTVVSCDLRQLTREHEARALKAARVTAIYFGPFWPQAAWLTKNWRTIDGFVNGTERGTVAEIKHNGKADVTPL